MAVSVMLTGASGFVALHILNELLVSGYDVVAVVRNELRANDVAKVIKNLGHDTSRVKFAYAGDISVSGAYDEAVKAHPEVTKVLHTASPFVVASTNYRDLLDPAVNGTVNILKAIATYAPQVDHVVVTSSVVAMINRTKPLTNEDVFTEKSWNEITEDQAKAGGPGAYGYSKTQAERAFWKFIEDEKPNFVGTTINPPFVFGPLLSPVSSPDKLNTSSQFVWNMSFTGSVDQKYATGCVDGRDVASAHVIALKKPQVAAGKRWFIGPYTFCPKKVLASARKTNFPAYNGKFQELDESIDADEIVNSTFVVDWSATKKDLDGDLKFHSFDDMIKDTLASFNEFGLKP